MKMDVYQERACDTAVYPKDMGLLYLALGLANEAGEVAGKVKKAIRDSGWEPGSELSTDDQLRIIDEIGDTLWYLAVLSKEVGIELSTVAEANLSKLADRKIRGVLGGSGDKR